MKKRPTWPRIRRRRNSGGSISYVVDLGKFGSKTKVRPRHAFKKKSDAEAFAAAKRRERDAGGFEVVALTETKRAEWVHCQKLAQEAGHSIIELLQMGLQAITGKVTSTQATSTAMATTATKPAEKKTVTEVIEEFAAHLRWKNRHKRNHDNAHARIVRGVLRKVLGVKLESAIAVLTLQDLKDALSKVTAKSAHKVQGNVQSLFRFAAEDGRRYIIENVSDGLGKACKPTAEDDEEEPAILALWEVKALLYTAQSAEEFHELIPCVTVQLFNSARLAEAERLPPIELNVSLDEIKFGAGVAKREARRTPEYHPTLKAWLKAYPPTKPKLVPSGYHAKLRKLRQAAGLVRGKYAPIPSVCPNPPEWGRSIFRHTYGSNFYGYTQDKQKTLYNMGHTSPRTFFKHYGACVKKHHAEAFWEILPLDAAELAKWNAQRTSSGTLRDLFPSELGSMQAFA